MSIFILCNIQDCNWERPPSGKHSGCCSSEPSHRLSSCAVASPSESRQYVQPHPRQQWGVLLPSSQWRSSHSVSRQLPSRSAWFLPLQLPGTILALSNRSTWYCRTADVLYHNFSLVWNLWTSFLANLTHCSSNRHHWSRHNLDKSPSRLLPWRVPCWRFSASSESSSHPLHTQRWSRCSKQSPHTYHQTARQTTWCNLGVEKQALKSLKLLGKNILKFCWGQVQLLVFLGWIIRVFF